MIKYFSNQKCGKCGSENLYSEVDTNGFTKNFIRCCMCNKVVEYFYHAESDCVIEADTEEEAQGALYSGFDPITYHQFWSFNMGLGL